MLTAGLLGLGGIGCDKKSTTSSKAAPAATPTKSDKPEKDKGTPDKGTPDKGTPDKGTPDKGTPDKGTPDKGGKDGKDK
jgi:hypothetical protein